MAVWQILDFLKAATGYVKPEEADLEAAGGEDSLAARYHTRVVITAGVCGIIGAIAGPICVLLEPGNNKSDTKIILLSPLMSGVAGILVLIVVGGAIALAVKAAVGK